MWVIAWWRSAVIIYIRMVINRMLLCFNWLVRKKCLMVKWAISFVSSLLTLGVALQRTTALCRLMKVVMVWLDCFTLCVIWKEFIMEFCMKLISFVGWCACQGRQATNCITHFHYFHLNTLSDIRFIAECESVCNKSSKNSMSSLFSIPFLCGNKIVRFVIIYQS